MEPVGLSTRIFVSSSPLLALSSRFRLNLHVLHRYTVVRLSELLKLDLHNSSLGVLGQIGQEVWLVSPEIGSRPLALAPLTTKSLISDIKENSRRNRTHRDRGARRYPVPTQLVPSSSAVLRTL